MRQWQARHSASKGLPDARTAPTPPWQPPPHWPRSSRQRIQGQAHAVSKRRTAPPLPARTTEAPTAAVALSKAALASSLSFNKFAKGTAPPRRQPRTYFSTRALAANTSSGELAAAGVAGGTCTWQEMCSQQGTVAGGRHRRKTAVLAARTRAAAPSLTVVRAADRPGGALVAAQGVLWAFTDLHESKG